MKMHTQWKNIKTMSILAFEVIVQSLMHSFWITLFFHFELTVEADDDVDFVFHALWLVDEISCL